MRRPTYSQVVSTLALFVALGGTSYAVTSLPADSVGTAQLKSASVTAGKLHAHAVGAAAVASDSLTGKQIDEASLGTVPHAVSANTADSATTAKTAKTADSATTATTATTALTANNSTLLAGAPASSYHAACPAGLLQIKDLCVEPDLRPAADFRTAIQTCALAGRRLPGFGEAVEAFNVLGAPQPSEWVAEFYVDSSNGALAGSVSEDSSRTVDFGSGSYDLTAPYRCVATATS